MTRIVLILSLSCSWIATFAQEVSTYVSSKEVTGKTAKLPWWKRVGGSDQTSGK